MPPNAQSASSKDFSVNLGFETGLWFGDTHGQDIQWEWRQRPFGLTTPARRVRVWGVQSERSNAILRRLTVINLDLRGIDADFGPGHADTFRRSNGMSECKRADLRRCNCVG